MASHPTESWSEHSCGFQIICSGVVGRQETVDRSLHPPCWGKWDKPSIGNEDRQGAGPVYLACRGSKRMAPFSVALHWGQSIVRVTEVRRIRWNRTRPTGRKRISCLRHNLTRKKWPLGKAGPNQLILRLFENVFIRIDYFNTSRSMSGIFIFEMFHSSVLPVFGKKNSSILERSIYSL